MKINSKQLVYIVDDDPDDRESIRDAFLENNHRHHYQFMQNGEQLLSHLAKQSNDCLTFLILLDLNMPGLSGRDVLKEIKENEALQSIPVIVLTTSASEKDRRTSYELGANCFLTKPDSYQDLVEITDSIARLWFAA